MQAASDASKVFVALLTMLLPMSADEDSTGNDYTRHLGEPALANPHLLSTRWQLLSHGPHPFVYRLMNAYVWDVCLILCCSLLHLSQEML